MENSTDQHRRPLLVITGPTASGKTGRAVDCARILGGEIISADSRQIYTGMDIGTGKDLADYGTDVPYHMIDICPAGYKYNLFEYLRDADRAIADIEARRRRPIVCGGTGLYVESLVAGLRLPEVPVNPELRESLRGRSLPELTAMLASMKQLHNTTDVDTVARAIRAIEIRTYYDAHPEEAENASRSTARRRNAVVVGVAIDRDSRRERISRRLRSRLDEGMLAETQRLLDSGIAPADLIYYGLEYKYTTLHLIGQLTYDAMVSGLETAIHQFAKRQMTWFRGMERRGIPIHWLSCDLPRDEFVGEVKKILGE